MRVSQFKAVFTEFIPDHLEEGVLYISEKYKTASHKCACGCGEEVVTPLSPVEWQLRRDGNFVSLHPSIGNWNYACRSHYWIRRNQVQWAGNMSQRQIAMVQAKDKVDKERYIARTNHHKSNRHESQPSEQNTGFIKWVSSTVRSAINWLIGR